METREGHGLNYSAKYDTFPIEYCITNFYTKLVRPFPMIAGYNRNKISPKVCMEMKPECDSRKSCALLILNILFPQLVITI